MGSKVRIEDGDGSGLEAHVHRFTTAKRKDHAGLLSLTRPFLDFRPEFHPFLNSTFGTAMNQNITFGGSGLRATIIHAGVNSGSAITGTTDASPQTDKLVDVSGGFNAAIGPGALVHNTTPNPDEFALVTNVDSDTLLNLDSDIMDAGSENYVINDIWPGTAVVGTWNFADGGKFTITSADNNDEATFTVDSSHIWNATNFTALTGKVDLDIYNPVNNTMILAFGLDGVLVGNPVNIDDFVDTGDFTEQAFVIPKEDFGLTTQNFNSMRLIILRTAGTKPTIKFDDFQWENSGTPAIFKATTPLGTRFHINEIRIRIEDAFDSTLANSSIPNIPIDQFLGVSALTNGILFSSVKAGKTLFNVTLKDIGDFLATGSNLINATGNGTNSGFTLVVEFPEPIVLEGGASENFLSFTINDNISGLTRFTAAARGALEV